MSESKIKECLSQYSSYMEEVKRRTAVITRLRDMHKNGQSMTGYMETDIDLVYLQLRKMIELVLFACVVANKAAGVKLNKTLRKGWELKKIKAELERFNSDFFPSPKVEGEARPDGVRTVDNLKQSERPYLTEGELFHTYGITGNYSHAKREYQYGDAEEKLKILLRGFEFTMKLVALLNHHWVQVSPKSHFAVVMQGRKDGSAHVSHMEQIEK